MSHCQFRHGIYIDEGLLGKSIPISLHLDGKVFRGKILFPGLKRTDIGDSISLYDIISPTSFQKFGYSAIDNWGEVRIQCKDKDKDITDILPSINGIAFIIECSNNDFTDKIETLLESYVSKFCSELMFLHPDAFVEEFDIRGDYAVISGWAIAGKNGIKPSATIQINLRSSTSENIQKMKVGHTELLSVLRDLDKDIKLQYELLSDLIRSKKEHNYRSAVLFGAMIIEVTLKDVISQYLNDVGCDEKVKHIIEKKMRNGFSSLIDIVKELGIDSPIHQKCKSLTIDVRNRIMHGGYMPTNEDSNNSEINARSILLHYCVPFFEQ